MFLYLRPTENRIWHPRFWWEPAYGYLPHGAVLFTALLAVTTGGGTVMSVCVVQTLSLLLFISTAMSTTDMVKLHEWTQRWAYVGPRFFAWVAQITPKNRTALLVGHNVIKHDVPLLKKETLAQCPDAMPKLMLWCDTLAAVRSVMLDLKKRDQRSVYAHIYGAPPLAHGTHTAFGDARTNAAIARDGMTPNVVAENILRDSLEPRLPRAEMDERTRRRMQWESKKAVINLKRKR